MRQAYKLPIESVWHVQAFIDILAVNGHGFVDLLGTIQNVRTHR